MDFKVPWPFTLLGSTKILDCISSLQLISDTLIVNLYLCRFKTSDGVSRKEEGQLITVGEHQGIGVRGSYSYNAPDGQQYIVTFVADDKGFKPTIRVADPQ